jgi:asparagine synthase (glutamine-hydrolysing)
MDAIERYLSLIGIFTENDKRQLYGPEFRAAVPEDGSARYLRRFWTESQALDRVNRWLRLDFKTYLPECLMTKVDIATMANSLEGRSPLLDHEFVELCFKIKGNWKLKGLRQTKWIFRRTFKDLIPPLIFNRKKAGFGLPLRAWFQGRLKTLLNETILDAGSFSRRHFQMPYLKRLMDEHASGRRDHGYRLWNLLMLDMWAGNR